MTREGGRYIVPDDGGEPVKADEGNTTAEKTQAKPVPAATAPEQADQPRPDKKKGS